MARCDGKINALVDWPNAQTAIWWVSEVQYKYRGRTLDREEIGDWLEIANNSITIPECADALKEEVLARMPNTAGVYGWILRTAIEEIDWRQVARRLAKLCYAREEIR